MIKAINIICILSITVLCGQSVPYFDGGRAMFYLEEQCEFGPRYPGSEAHEKTAKYFEEFLKPLADELLVMRDTVQNPITKKDVGLTNLFARYNPKADYRIMFLAHWDTREIAEKDPDPKNREKPIIGANDGASGIAVLMVLAEILHDNPVDIGVDLLFVDGEDMGLQGQMNTWGIGTLYFSKRIPDPYPQYAVCLDMIGDAELEILIEQFSYQQAPHIVDKVWRIAAELGYSQFIREFGSAVYDDHRVLWEQTRIPAIDIIDFKYPNENLNYWHTQEDTPDKCSAESLEAVGMVVTTLIYLENEQRH